MFLYLLSVAADDAAQEVVVQVVEFHLQGGFVARGFDTADIVHIGHALVVGEHLQGADDLERYAHLAQSLEGVVGVFDGAKAHSSGGDAVIFCYLFACKRNFS